MNKPHLILKVFIGTWPGEVGGCCCFMGHALQTLDTLPPQVTHCSGQLVVCSEECRMWGRACLHFKSRVPCWTAPDNALQHTKGQEQDMVIRTTVEV